MKVFISADIEGVAGIATRNEVLKDHPDYAEFQQQMTRSTLYRTPVKNLTRTMVNFLQTFQTSTIGRRLFPHG